MYCQQQHTSDIEKGQCQWTNIISQLEASRFKSLHQLPHFDDLEKAEEPKDAAGPRHPQDSGGPIIELQKHPQNVWYQHEKIKPEPRAKIGPCYVYQSKS